jgi:hypothetical protein
MVLSASVASATDFTASGMINEANGWEINGVWLQNIEDGTFSEGVATASHPVATGASGQFDYLATFKIADTTNYVKIGLIAGGHEYKMEYKDGWFWFDGVKLNQNLAVPTATHTAHIFSSDGKVWEVSLFGPTKYYDINAVPTDVTMALTDNAGDRHPVIYTLNFDSPGEPAVIVPAPAAADNSGIDVAQVQNFYDNIYPNLPSPYDTVTYNADGSYTIVKGYPTSATHYVAGTVTSAADGSPIVEASVVLGDTLQKTDSLGKFRFEDIATGITDIAVSADGFAAQTQSINVNTDKLLSFNLDKAAAGGSTIASAANESDNVTATTNVTMPTNATVAPTMAPTTPPSATQTKSPGFEGIIAAIAMIGVAGALVYLNKKH